MEEIKIYLLDKNKSFKFNKLIQKYFKTEKVEVLAKIWDQALSLKKDLFFEDENIKKNLFSVLKNLNKKFNIKPFDKIHWILGDWNVGALSLVRGSEIYIISGASFYESNEIKNTLSHIPKHELLHHFLRHYISKKWWNSQQEEWVVQYESKWELAPEILEKNKEVLKKIRKSINDGKWENLEILMGDLGCF